MGTPSEAGTTAVANVNRRILRNIASLSRKLFHRRQPTCGVADVSLYIGQPRRIAFDLMARWFIQKAWTTFRRVPIVIDEVMKTRFCYCSTQVVPMSIACTLKRNDKIEITPTYLTLPRCDDACVIFTIRYTDAAFMRMRREILNHTRRSLEQFMHGIDCFDPLVVAIRPRMIIGPVDCSTL